LGELLVTAGVVVLLYCVYDLVWTGVETGRVQDRLTSELTQRWRDERTAAPARPAATPSPGPASTGSSGRLPARGEGLAVLHIPRLGDDFAWVVVEGVGTTDLARGPGHYPGTAMPGEVGNFAVAGHRATHGEPFRRLDLLRRGDTVIVETATAYYTYTVDRTRITGPDDVDVVLPVPGRPGAVPDRALLTLTTCHPRWSSTQRLIVSGYLSATDPVGAGQPGALRGGEDGR
jgi:sortase A